MKLQILPLPEEYAGEYSATPYALIASEVPKIDVQLWGDALHKLNQQKPGYPVWTLATSDTVEL